MVKKVSVVINGDRGQLGEGRAYGLGFAFCEKTENGFKTVQPPSTCKDYLNDVLAIEKFFPKATISIYGLNYKATGNVFDKTGISHLFVQPLPYKGTIAFYDIDKERKEFPTRIDNILTVLRSFEEQMGFKTETKVQATDQDGGFIFTVPAEWGTSTYMISLYALMIRGAAYLKLNDPLGTFLGVPALDTGMVGPVRVKIDYMLKTKTLPEFNVENFRSGPYGVSSNVHNAGIVGWVVPTTKYAGKNPITDEAILK